MKADHTIDGKIKAVAIAAEKEAALNVGQNKQSKIYRKRLEQFRDLGLTLNTTTNDIPTPESVLRILDVVKLIQKGKTKLDVLEWVQNEYGVALNTAKAYYTAAANFLLPEDASKAKEEAIGILQARYEELYKRAYEAGQLKTARDILDSLAKLNGLAGGNSIKYAENANGERMVVVTFD